MPELHLRTPVLATVRELYDWHARPGAFERLVPPFDPVRLVSRSGPGLAVGTRLELEAKVGPVPVRWTSVHTAHTPPGDGDEAGFEDTQESGPFRRWVHRHRFVPDTENAENRGNAILEDRVDWEAPGGALGAAVVAPRLARGFRFRHERTVRDLRRHAEAREILGDRRLRIAITGRSGLVGTELAAFLQGGGHEVLGIGRGAGSDVRWDPERGVLDAAALEGLDAVVNLAGEPLTGPTWTDERKARLRASRVDGTALLARTLAGLARKPKVLVSASAVGVLGDRGEEAVDEDAAPGTGFLADLCRGWEAATGPAADAGIRVAHLRVGIVQSAKGAALHAMLPAFRAGAGGPLGTGAQWLPWVHLDDLLGITLFLLVRDDLAGPFFGVSPGIVRQGDHARALGRVLGRPALVPAPRFALGLVFGAERAAELVLASQRAVPRRLRDAGYRFEWPELEDALRFELGLEPDPR